MQACWGCQGVPGAVAGECSAFQACRQTQPHCVVITLVTQSGWVQSLIACLACLCTQTLKDTCNPSGTNKYIQGSDTEDAAGSRGGGSGDGKGYSAATEASEDSGHAGAQQPQVKRLWLWFIGTWYEVPHLDGVSP